MMNSTQLSYFTLAAYFDTGALKYFYFMVIFLLYIFIVSANVFLIVVICMNRSLHDPMYLFLCSLFVNELYGSTGLFPFLLLQVLSDIHTVSKPFCFLQIFCAHTYGGVEYLNLAIMSYDRYLAICYPLQYNTHQKKSIKDLAQHLEASPGCQVIVNTITRCRQHDNTMSSTQCRKHVINTMSSSRCRKHVINTMSSTRSTRQHDFAITMSPSRCRQHNVVNIITST
ncbi:olfactory receptor 142-like [Scomber scombrus]|uniref:Olfactory receptor 142-like n=1 Tax=Scomber scombrus TaxID=13677 RepID=A0AAV1QCY4_SCOSC